MHGNVILIATTNVLPCEQCFLGKVLGFSSPADEVLSVYDLSCW